MTSDEKALTFFGTAGFEFWHTGGGCTAFGRHISDDPEDSRYVMVTATYDDGSGPVAEAYHPHDDDTIVCVG